MTVSFTLNHEEAGLLYDAMTEYTDKRAPRRTEKGLDCSPEEYAAYTRLLNMKERLIEARADTMDDAPFPRLLTVYVPVTETQYTRLCEIWKSLERQNVSYPNAQHLFQVMMNIGSCRLVNERLTFWEDWIRIEEEERSNRHET